MTDYTKLVKALRCCATMTCKGDDCRYMILGCHDCFPKLHDDAADAIEALVKRVKCAEEKIKLYKGEADLYKDLYRSAHEAFTKELYGSHGTLENLQSLKQSPIPHNLCPNRAEEVYNLCANYPEKPDSSENPNGSNQFADIGKKVLTEPAKR